MKRVARTLLLAGPLVIIAAACTKTVGGSGKVVTKHVRVSPFTRLRVEDAFDVKLALGPKGSVTLRVDDNVVDRVDVGVSDGTLHIGLKPNTSVHDVTLHADVISPKLSGIEVAGAGHVAIENELGPGSVDLTASGAGRIEGSLRVESANITLDGASRAELDGSAGHLTVKESGASGLEAPDLQATELEIDLSGASSASITVTDTASATASGASTLRYGGSPQFIRQEASGGSSITHL